MQVILLERVGKLGVMGDVVRVAPGYARNFLIPQKKARLATKEALQDFQARRAELEAQQDRLKHEAQGDAQKMEDVVLSILRQAGENKHLYGSVTAKDIASLLSSKTGLALTRSSVLLMHPIKELGVFKARVALHAEVSVEILVNVAQTEQEAEQQLKAFRGETEKSQSSEISSS